MISLEEMMNATNAEKSLEFLSFINIRVLARWILSRLDINYISINDATKKLAVYRVIRLIET